MKCLLAAVQWGQITASGVKSPAVVSFMPSAVRSVRFAATPCRLEPGTVRVVRAPVRPGYRSPIGNEGEQQWAHIMPLGDSITWGTGGDGGGGYHPPLIQDMVVGRYSSDMVGSHRSRPPQLYDRDHEGYHGHRIDQITALVAGELTTYRLEFVLLQIGTNDVLQQYQLATAPDRLRALIDLITDTAPDARLVGRLHYAACRPGPGC
jgi:hypothetical protein